MDVENKLGYQPVSPDVFQQQMMGSFCSLINGQLLLAETFADTSQTIKTSVAELIKTVEEMRQEICKEMKELKATFKQNFINNDKPVPGSNETIKSNKAGNVIVPPVVQGMLDKLEAVTSKLSNFKTLTCKSDISNVSLEKSVAPSTDNDNNSNTQSENGEVQTNTASSSKPMSNVTLSKSGSPTKSQIIVIKREREESSDDKSNNNTQSDDSNSSNNDKHSNNSRRRPKSKRLSAIISRVNAQSALPNSSDNESEFEVRCAKNFKPAGPMSRGRGRVKRGRKRGGRT